MTINWRAWVFRSTLAAVVLLVVGTTAVAGYHLIDTDPAASPALATSAPTPPPVGPSGPSGPTSEPADTDGWRAAAAVYGEAFTDTTGGIVAWRDRMGALVSPALVRGYAYTDLAAIPQEELVRTSRGDVPVAGETPSQLVRLFYTGDLVIDITVSFDPTPGGRGWVITAAVPVEERVGDPDQTPLPAPTSPISPDLPDLPA